MITRSVLPGDVFQINERHKRSGWIGALLMAEEVKSWGIVGFIHVPKTDEQKASIYVRMLWEEIDYIGRAPLHPFARREAT
jgi:hypothetical protein